MMMMTMRGGCMGSDLILQSARTAVSMSPEVLARLERLRARRTLERAVRGVNALVQSDGGRVLEALAAVTAGALVQVAVAVQVVFLEVHAQFEPDVALLATVRSLLSAANCKRIVQ